jgi:hypothetical protein
MAHPDAHPRTATRLDGCMVDRRAVEQAPRRAWPATDFFHIL